jgi:hypothetical protein
VHGSRHASGIGVPIEEIERDRLLSEEIVHTFREGVEAGGLMSYGPNVPDC